MAGTFSPKNVGKLLIGAANLANNTIAAYVTNSVAATLQVGLISADGEAIASGDDFKVYVKENDTASGINGSDVVGASAIDAITAHAHVAEVAKQVDITGFTGTVLSNTTYRVSIRKYDHIQSSENFRHIHGFAVTGPSTALTWAQIMAEIKSNLDIALARENANSEFLVTQWLDKLEITSLPQTLELGKKQGLPVRFDVEVSTRDNFPQDLNDQVDLGTLTATVIAEGTEGQGTGKQVLNLEYFLKAYDNADYSREVGFPHNFAPTYIANAGSAYNTCVIRFHKDREGTNVERQPKELTIAMAEAYTAPVAEVCTIQVTAAATVAGTATVVIDGVSVNLPLTIDTIAVNAGEIAVAIDALATQNALSDGVDTVTITARVKEAQTDIATYAAGTATSSAATLAVVTQGVDEAMVFTQLNLFLDQLETAGAPFPADLS